MKFEIDDNTGMVNEEISVSFLGDKPMITDSFGRFASWTIDKDNNINYEKGSSHDVGKVNTHQLEIILQAVKKTQEKIVNKQIQEIQDSKNQKELYSIIDQFSAYTPPTELPEMSHKLIKEFENFIRHTDGYDKSNYFDFINYHVKTITGKDL